MSESLEPTQTLVVVVTGLSGAGRSTALHALEDLGFFCIDSLPTALAPEAVRLCERGGVRRVALGIDVRVRAFLGPVGQLLRELGSDGERKVDVLFVDASDETLLRRFSETRRPHALSTQTGGEAGAFAVLDGVRLERERLANVRAAATVVLDTTDLSVHDLRRSVITHFGPASAAERGLRVRLVSFGFKYGTPVDADWVFDVRFIENPYFVPALKSLPGTRSEVREFVLSREDTAPLLAKLEDLAKFVLPRAEREGKSYLTLAIGCTGGRHRSVVIAEELAGRLGDRVRVFHRDVAKADTLHLSIPPEQAAMHELAAELSPLPQPASRKLGPK